jgi:hypothetical protein
LSEKDLNRPIRLSLRVSEPDSSATSAADASTFVPGNDRVNRQFEQALKGTNGDRDTAAIAVDAISKAPGYKPDQNIAVVQGRIGQMIATQGQGDTAVNVPVPQAKQGEFERVSAQMTQQPPQQQIAVQPEPQERKRPTV